ncbi:MAG: hypothetical protein KC466_18585, partial [Myxococcales bacterium]|nr:hypothetical protein [Myxococcales bacterium]
DGVNDAPALKQANVGVAVSGATDAARSAADLVLTAPGLSVIIEAIRESRRIFRRMNSYAVYRIAETIRLLLFMTLSILIFDFYPVTAAMIVLLALFNDGPILLIAYDRVEPDPRPTRWDMRTVLGIATILGILGVVASFGVLWAGEMWLHLGRAQIQTLIFLKLMVAGNLTIYLCRTGPDPFWTRPFPAPSLVWVGFGTRVLATAAAALGWLVEPIGWKLAAGVWVYSIAWFVVNDAVKVWARRLMTHQTRWDRPHAQRIHAAVRG